MQQRATTGCRSWSGEFELCSSAGARPGWVHPRRTCPLDGEIDAQQARLAHSRGLLAAHKLPAANTIVSTSAERATGVICQLDRAFESFDTGTGVMCRRSRESTGLALLQLTSGYIRRQKV